MSDQPVPTPWYEARLSVHVRPGPPSTTFGEGGEELAHVRASTEAPSFPEAIARLDADLGIGWERMKANAHMVDMPPSPEVLPPVPKRLEQWVKWIYANPLVGWWVAFLLLWWLLILW